MSPIKHVAFSGMISGLFAFLTHSLGGTIACFVSGIFIDLDHVLDYWLAKKKFFCTYGDLDHYYGKDPKGQLIILLHSYELLGIMTALSFSFHYNKILVGLTVGLAFHMLLDIIGNPVKPMAYFFVYRIFHKFQKAPIFNDGRFDENVAT